MSDVENVIKRAAFDTILVTTLWSISISRNLSSYKLHFYMNEYSMDIVPQYYTIIAMGTTIMMLIKYYK